MMIIEKPAHRSNYALRSDSGIRTPVLAIVIHRMAGSLAGTASWFAIPPSNRGGKGASSAHYGIGQRGEIHRYVDENYAAYHVGAYGTAKLKETFPWVIPNVNLNLLTIGIEHEGKGSEPWSEAMLNSSAELIANIATRYRMLVSAATIVPHGRLARTECPGPVCPIDELISKAASKLPEKKNHES